MFGSLPVLVSAAAAGLAAGAGPAFTDVTTYRLSPKNGKADVTGLTNVDSGDAGGDALFGLSNLLLPQLCAVEPSFLWCENRGSLSGGSQWMVYTEYTVAAKAFGEYAACNPCQAHFNGTSREAPPKCPPGEPDGTFVCQGYNQPSGDVPKQCQSGFDIWHRDCLNGTVFKTLEAATEGECCAACTAAKGTCAGWNMPAGYNGSVCQLMKEPVTMWEDGQAQSSCKAAQVYHGQQRCWYDEPQYNASFAGICKRSECTCEAISVQAMGREVGAMCHHNRRRMEQKAPAPPPPPPGYWACTAALQEVCPFDDYRRDPHGCSNCAHTHKAELDKAGCNAAAIVHGCEGDYEGCFEAFDKVCDKSARGSTGSCLKCAFEHQHAKVLEAANCTDFFVDYECQGGGGGGNSNPWEEYINKLGCHLNGTWYSTRAEGECKPGKESDASCLWKVKATGRTVNQTCVDGNVIAVVEKLRPDCFSACPQPTNQTSACYLHCFFDTMVGNSKTKVKAMEPTAIIEPFTRSFTETDPAKGGCPSV